MAELATERMVVTATPEQCFAVVSDIERYPEWAADIKQVVVERRDDEGRPAEATFRAGAFGRSTSYTLAYDYSGAPRTLAWKQTAGDLTSKLDGSYRFDTAGRRVHRGHLHPRGRAAGPAAGLHQAPGAEPHHAHRPRGAQGARRVLAHDVSGGPAAGRGVRARAADRAGAMASEVTDRDRRGGHESARPRRRRARVVVLAEARRIHARTRGDGRRRRRGVRARDRHPGGGGRAAARRAWAARCRRWGWGRPAWSTTRHPPLRPEPPCGTGLDIAGRLTARLGGLRTVVDNDATCATVAEWAFGAAAGADDAVHGDARHRHRRRGHRRRARGAGRVGLRGRDRPHGGRPHRGRRARAASGAAGSASPRAAVSAAWPATRLTPGGSTRSCSWPVVTPSRCGASTSRWRPRPATPTRWPCWASSGGGSRSAWPIWPSSSTPPSWSTAAGWSRRSTLVLDGVRGNFDEHVRGPRLPPRGADRARRARRARRGHRRRAGGARRRPVPRPTWPERSGAARRAGRGHAAHLSRRHPRPRCGAARRGARARRGLRLRPSVAHGRPRAHPRCRLSPCSAHSPRATTRLCLGPLVARVGLRPRRAHWWPRWCRCTAMAPGRLIAGLGTGDSKSAAENLAYGVEFDPADERRLALRRSATALLAAGIPVWVGAGPRPPTSSLSSWARRSTCGRANPPRWPRCRAGAR